MLNSKRKALLLAAGLALLLGGAVFAYNSLSKDNVPPVVVAEGPATESSAGGDTTGADTSSGDTDKIPAPDFRMQDWEGDTVRLSDLFGKPIVLNFWASWCPPCKGEMPEFDAVWLEVGEEVTFVMVDLADGQRETVGLGKAFVSDQGFSFPVYFDTEQDAAYAYGIRAIPTTLFIDKDGYIVVGAQGAIDEKSLRTGIDLIR